MACGDVWGHSFSTQMGVSNNVALNLVDYHHVSYYLNVKIAFWRWKPIQPLSEIPTYHILLISYICIPLYGFPHWNPIKPPFYTPNVGRSSGPPRRAWSKIRSPRVRKSQTCRTQCSSAGFFFSGFHSPNAPCMVYLRTIGRFWGSIFY